MANKRLPNDLISRLDWLNKGNHGAGGTLKAIRLHRPTPVGWGNPNSFIAALDLSRISPFRSGRIAAKSMSLMDGEEMDTESPSVLSQITDLFKSAGGAYSQYAQTQTQIANTQTAQRLNAARIAGNTGFISGLPSGTMFGIPTSALMLGVAGLLAFKLLKR
jgi:hypothetical protein